MRYKASVTKEDGRWWVNIVDVASNERVDRTRWERWHFAIGYAVMAARAWNQGDELTSSDMERLGVFMN